MSPSTASPRIGVENPRRNALHFGVPCEERGYIFPVKADVRRKTEIASEDAVTVTLELL